VTKLRGDVPVKDWESSEAGRLFEADAIVVEALKPRVPVLPSELSFKSFVSKVKIV